MAEPRELSTVVKEFNLGVTSLIQRVEKKTRSENVRGQLDRAKARIRLLRDTMGDSALVNIAHPFFIEYSDNILEENSELREGFFLSMDFRAEYERRKNKVSNEDEFVLSLIDAIKELYKKVSQKEKDEVYLSVRNLLIYSIEYKMITNPDQ